MNRFKMLREKNKFTQAMVSARLGVRQSTISMWENGYTLPRGSILLRIAKLYGCTLDELLETGAPEIPEGCLMVSAETRQQTAETR